MFVADDFGISTEANRAIELAHRAGVVRYVSIMVIGDGVEEAVAIARDCPGMVVGLHLVVDGLIGVERAVWAGTRYEGLSGLVSRPSLRAAMARECERQVEAFLSFGFPPTFLNSHFHIHILPPLFELFVDIAEAYGFSFIRFSPNDALLVHPDLPISSDDLSSMAIRLEGRGIRHSDWYRPTFCYFYPPDLREGLTEIAFHPAWGDSEIGYLDLVRLLSWGNILESRGDTHVVT